MWLVPCSATYNTPSTPLQYMCSKSPVVTYSQLLCLNTTPSSAALPCRLSSLRCWKQLRSPSLIRLIPSLCVWENGIPHLNRAYAGYACSCSRASSARLPGPFLPHQHSYLWISWVQEINTIKMVAYLPKKTISHTSHEVAVWMIDQYILLLKSVRIKPNPFSYKLEQFS